MDKLREMASFVAVVDNGSFVAAADATGQSKAAISRHVGDLEQRLHVRLLQRTTRRISMSPEGQAFYARCKEVLGAVEDAEAEVTSTRKEPSGLIRINAPLTFGIRHLAPLWGEFSRLNPEVSLDVTLTDRVVDLVEEGYDVAVRISAIGSANLVRRNLATTRLVLCASPEYLDTHGTPLSPEDLAAHRVIAYSYTPSPDEWRFTGPGGETMVRIHAWMQTNNGDTCREAALDGEGLILQPDFLVSEDLDAGRLIECIPRFRAARLKIDAVYPTRKYLPLKIRRLVDFLAAEFRPAPWLATSGFSAPATARDSSGPSRSGDRRSP